VRALLPAARAARAAVWELSAPGEGASFFAAVEQLGSGAAATSELLWWGSVPGAPPAPPLASLLTHGLPPPGWEAVVDALPPGALPFGGAFVFSPAPPPPPPPSTAARGEPALLLLCEVAAGEAAVHVGEGPPPAGLPFGVHAVRLGGWARGGEAWPHGAQGEGEGEDAPPRCVAPALGAEGALVLHEPAFARARYLVVVEEEEEEGGGGGGGGEQGGGGAMR
jgi:hypothetical protein